MKDCCETKVTAEKSVTSKSSDRVSSLCPHCGRLGKRVDSITLRSLLTPEALKRFERKAQYLFCDTENCPVVYFNGEDRFNRWEILVPVFQKEPQNPQVPVCYCFHFTPAKIAEEIHLTGQSTAISEISRYVQEGKCACELRNPQGRCCLGNVSLVVKKILGANK